MARTFEPTEQQIAEWSQWVSSRPECVRLIAERFSPWILYRMESTGHRVTLRSFYEDGTISVNVTANYNFLIMERWVFGIDPDDLEECDLPGEGELVGCLQLEVEGVLQ